MPLRPASPCRHCGTLKRGGRCPRCAPYKGDWPTIRAALLEDHLKVYGHWCPGIKTATGRLTFEHTVKPHQLTVDHINGDPRDNRRFNLRVVCRSCNTTARNRS